jgi:hypothetical protein
LLLTWEVIVDGRTCAEDGAMKSLLLVVLLAFSLLTGVAVLNHGVWGIFEPLVTTWSGAQVLADLVIALSLFLAWMWRDAKRSGRNPWPWFLLTLAAGSFGPLLYMLTRRMNSEEHR